MLDERIKNLATKGALVEIKDSELPFRAAINRILVQHRHRGGKYILLAQEFRSELGRRAKILWRNLHRAHGSRSNSTNDVRADLMDAFKAGLEEIVAAMRPEFSALMKDAPGKHADVTSVLNDARDHEFARHEVEIEHYVADLEEVAKRGARPAGGYHFYGHVGAVMTGAGAVAHVVQNIGTEERETLRSALDLVRQTLKADSQLPERDRREVLELTDEATEEISKDSPNTKRLSMALQSIAATVQGIASGPAAYEVLRTAAAAIGIPI